MSHPPWVVRTPVLSTPRLPASPGLTHVACLPPAYIAAQRLGGTTASSRTSRWLPP